MPVALKFGMIGRGWQYTTTNGCNSVSAKCLEGRQPTTSLDSLDVRNRFFLQGAVNLVTGKFWPSSDVDELYAWFCSICVQLGTAICYPALAPNSGCLLACTFTTDHLSAHHHFFRNAAVSNFDVAECWTSVVLIYCLGCLLLGSCTFSRVKSWDLLMVCWCMVDGGFLVHLGMPHMVYCSQRKKHNHC